MTNIISQVTARIESSRETNKNPCKNYATEASAEKATKKAALQVGMTLDKREQPARYVVFFIESWGRWVGALDMGELVKRDSFIGGYVGGIDGFYNF